MNDVVAYRVPDKLRDRVEIELEHDIGAVCLRLFYCFTPVSGFRTDLPPALGLQEGTTWCDYAFRLVNIGYTSPGGVTLASFRQAF